MPPTLSADWIFVRTEACSSSQRHGAPIAAMIS
jgi:hypothetical protein